MFWVVILLPIIMLVKNYFKARIITMKNDLNYQDVGVRIQKYRLLRNMTQDELSELIGTDQKYISRLECGYHNPSLSTIVAIAKALRISVDSLVADYNDSGDESNLHEILNEIRGMSALQLEMLRDIIKVLKKMDK